jgi:glycine cleavage system H protein
MTAILVLLTFALFLTIDYFRSRRPAVQAVRGVEPESPPLPRLQPAYVGGFETRDNLSYHPGHTWALSESPNLVRVGLDDLAAHVIGKIDAVVLPQRGQWIRQGQKIVTIAREGAKAELVSPIEGEVSGINEAVLKDVNLPLRDPYGQGWLLTVHSPDAKTNFRNLLGGGLARKWMEEAASRLQARIPALVGAVAQDGGVAVGDLAAHLPGQDWKELTSEFFLT